MAMQDTSAHDGSGQRSARSVGDGEDLNEIKHTLRESAHGLSTELKRESRRLMHDASESAASLANEKKSVAADYLRAVAEAAEASRQVLEQRGYAGSSRVLVRAVDGLGRFTETLSTREPGELLDEAVTTARRNPALFLGAALAAGFGLARLMQAQADADEMTGGEEGDDTMDMDDDDDMSPTDDGDEMTEGSDEP